MNQYSWTREERAIYDQAKKRDDDNVSCLKQKLNEGVEIGRQEGILIGEEMGRVEGKEEGRREEKIEVVKNLLKVGISIDVISQTTGLPKTEIKQLQEEIA